MPYYPTVFFSLSDMIDFCFDTAMDTGRGQGLRVVVT